MIVCSATFGEAKTSLQSRVLAANVQFMGRKTSAETLRSPAQHIKADIDPRKIEFFANKGRQVSIAAEITVMFCR